MARAGRLLAGVLFWTASTMLVVQFVSLFPELARLGFVRDLVALERKVEGPLTSLIRRGLPPLRGKDFSPLAASALVLAASVGIDAELRRRERRSTEKIARP